MLRMRVVVGVSGSPGSLQALRFAFDRACALDAALVPVIAWEPPGGDSAARPYPGSVTDGWADAAEERLLRAFDEGLGAPPDDLPAASHVIRGRPGHVLVAVADRPDDLLVVGSSRPGILRRAWSGSVTRHCLAHAACPVIAVPPTAPCLAALLEQITPHRGNR
jgi:nucleotide-binding universal stress UspA family protein